MVVAWKGDENAEGTDEWEVERILEEKGKPGTRSHEYLVRWRGFSSKEDKWVRAADLRAESLVKEFREQMTTTTHHTATDVEADDKGKEEMIPIPVARDIEEVLDHKKLRAGLRYQIRMTGSSKPTWVSDTELGDNMHVIQAYRRKVGLE